MDLLCDRELLKKYTLLADRITGKNLSLPVLGSILLVADNKKLTIRATNLEVGVEFHIPAVVKTEGSIAFPGSLLSNILSGIADEHEIHLSVKGTHGKISTKTKNITIKGFPSDDFPTIPITDTGDRFIISPIKFIQGVKAVVGSAAVSDIKPEIASVYIHYGNGDLVFTATDSFRLSEKKIKHQIPSFSQAIIVPTKNILEMVRILEQCSNEEITYIANKNQLSCVGESIYITSRIIQGVYPDYEQIIPKTYTTEIIALKQDLINTLKLSTFFADKFNKITFIVNPKNKQCLITTKNSDVGEIESNITATLSGEDVDVSLNGKHIFDALNAIEKDSVVLQFSGSGKPVVVRGLGDPSFTGLTMPLTQ